MLRQVWELYKPGERRNIAVYIIGIMFYKLGLEIFNGSMLSMSADRFAVHSAALTGAANGANQAAQCIGSILIAPLVMKWPTRIILATAILFFAIMSALLLIINAATGGYIGNPKAQAQPVSGCIRDESGVGAHYGAWDANLIFLVWTLAGVAYGMVELIRRIIPAEVVGGDVGKLRRMDALVHIFYEVTGTLGAIAGAGAISKLGNGYTLLLPPIFFAAAAASWFFLDDLGFHQRKSSIAESELSRSNDNYLIMIYHGFLSFVRSIASGTSLVLGSLQFIWLLPSYSLAFYLHRFLENALGLAFAKRMLRTSSWNLIITGGSNLGELFGALLVFVLSDYITTPLPWLRLGAITLNVAWILPVFSGIVHSQTTETICPNGFHPKPNVMWAWLAAICFLPMSLGWAAGDVSLSAYIQSHVFDNEAANGKGISALGSIMAFLYVSFIVLYATLGAGLGKILDNYANGHNQDITEPLKGVAGVQYSVCCGIMFLATFIPIGSRMWNPKEIGKAPTVSTLEEEEKEVAPERRHKPST